MLVESNCRRNTVKIADYTYRPTSPSNLHAVGKEVSLLQQASLNNDKIGS
jgi:hypothetical protein